MKLFENYLSGIENILDDNGNHFSNFAGVVNKAKKPSDILLKGSRSVQIFAEDAQRSLSLNAALPQRQINGDKVLFDFDRDGLQKLFGTNKSSFSDIVIGSHPDFLDIAHDGYCFHHCVSMFVDIKGSTRLALKHKLEKVRLIKDSLLTLCIHVANFFGGHVHRLQGDAVFVQFVRKGQHKNDAIINALNAASVLCQFVEKNLSEVFEKKGLTPIKIRIGIDYGNDEQVMWSHYGVPGCAELTTTSLHTDLAAKLQSKAKPNAIIVGDNVVKELDVPDEYLEYVQKPGSDEIETYIINEIRYKQHEFNWKKYLLSYDFINKSGIDSTLEIAENDYQLRCTISDGTSEENIYYQNSCSIPKGKSITFTIYYRNNPYHKQSFESITWDGFNRGAEAQAANQLRLNLTEVNKDLTHCAVHAAYLGNHYVCCKIVRNNLPNINLRFSVYIQ